MVVVVVVLRVGWVGRGVGGGGGRWEGERESRLLLLLLLVHPVLNSSVYRKRGLRFEVTERKESREREEKMMGGGKTKRNREQGQTRLPQLNPRFPTQKFRPATDISLTRVRVPD